MTPTVIKKRDGRIVSFDMKKIADAIEKSFRADGEIAGDTAQLADSLAWAVTGILEDEDEPAPTVEHMQDLVEQVLMERGYHQTAKRYILYRQARTDARARGEQGGALVLECWEPSLSGQAMAICAAVRNNGGAKRLYGYYESLAPGAENALMHHQESFFRLALEQKCGRRLSAAALRSVRESLRRGGLSPVGPGKNAWLTRQADLVCGILGCDREQVEAAQEAAWPYAVEALEVEAHRTLRQLQSRGCTREIVAPPEKNTPAVELLMRIDT